MNKPLCRNNQNTDRSKTVKFGVSTAQAKEKKKHVEKPTLKNVYCFLNQMQIHKVQ